MAEAGSSILSQDINSLTRAQQNEYLTALAISKGLDPLTRPFDTFPKPDGKLAVYANSGCADQLREKHNINIELVKEGPLVIGDKISEEVYIVWKKATMAVVPEEGIKPPDGTLAQFREHCDVGVVGISGLKGEALANAIMKAHTKAERRVTLGIKGLGIPDVSELDTIGAGGKDAVVRTEPKQVTPKPQVVPDLPEKKAIPSNGIAGNKFPPAKPPVSV